MIVEYLSHIVVFALVITMILGMIPVSVFARSDKDGGLVLDLDFDNMQPGDAFMQGEVCEYGGRKALKVTADKAGVNLTFDSLVIGECAMSFDVAAMPKSVTGEFGVQGGGTPAYVLKFTKDGKITTYNGKELTTYGEKFKTVTVVFDAEDKCFDVYVNGKCVASRLFVDITFDKVVTFNLLFASVEGSADVYLDNIHAYPTYVKTSKGTIYNPKAKPRNQNKKITLTSKTTIPSDEPQRAILKNSSSIHMRSGVAYDGKTKIMTSSLPFYESDEFMVPSDAAEHVLGLELKTSGDKITVGNDIELGIGSTQMTYGDKIADISVAPQIKDGTVYVPLRAVAEKALGKVIQYDDTTVHYGMVIISDKAVAMPAGDALQDLNDFCFFFRPTPQKFLEDYNASPLKGIHPRVIATEADFDRIREEVKTNEYKKRWKQNLYTYCDTISTYPPSKYELRDGVRLMYVSDEFQIYMFSLAMGYQLAKYEEPERAKKYFDAAWKHLESVAQMPDWNPSHHIDVGIMAIGYAVAYDWFYEILTPDQRALMEKGVYNNMFRTLNQAVESDKTPYGTVLMENNHNVFCNAGAMASCIAFMDVYPEVASKLGSDVMKILEVFIDKFAPLGGYYEGPSYATIAINYSVRLFSSMYPTMGTAYGADRAQGFDMAGEYLTNMQSDVASFNFADSQYGLASTNALFWLYDHYDSVGFKDALAETFKNVSGVEATQCLLWYEVGSEGEGGESVTKLDNRYAGEEIITMRNTYDAGQVFVGIKAGDTVYAHSHLDAGSFVFDALGSRWAYDFGQDDYNLYYKYNSWDVFRLRAESHNTLLINPDEEPGYVLGSRADVISYDSKPRGVITKINMTPLYGSDVLAAKRGYFFTDERRSLVVRDEVTFPKQSDAYWLMYISADAQIVDDHTVILSDTKNANKKIKIEWRSSVPGTIKVEDAKPFPTSPQIPEQKKNDGYYRLYYKISGKGAHTITAKITPLDFGGSDISQYDVNMDTWQIPDGELAEIPALDHLTIGGESYDVANRYVNIKVKDISDLPEIEADSDKYTVNIKNGTSETDPTVITLTDPDNTSNTVSYTISYEELMDISKYNLFKPAEITVSDEPQSENPKEAVADGNTNTRWSAENEQWLVMDYGKEVEFDTILMAMYLGDQRTSKVVIEISDDNETYTELTTVRTSGKTSDYEAFDVQKTNARYVKFNFSGTSAGNWNSPTELAVGTKK